MVRQAKNIPEALAGQGDPDLGSIAPWGWLTEKVEELSGGQTLIVLVIVVATAVAANVLAKRVMVNTMRKLARRTSVKWDDLLISNKVFARLAGIAPALVIYAWAGLLFPDASDSEALTRNLALAYMILVGGGVVAALLETVRAVLESDQTTDTTAMRSYFQLGKILLWLVVGILVVAKLLDKDPTSLLTGLGALMTVILLVFKDSILGFVASLQLTRDDLVRKGDWIEVPGYGADGDVLEVTLHAVKVQNWDKTIVTVPTPAMITGGFKNWRGMSESGGRRIKRALSLDMTSVCFLDEELLVRLKKVEYIQQYLDEKVTEVQGWNAEKMVDESSLVNGRRLTNLGTFRAYLELYLRNHPQISQTMTFLVRQLPPSADGIPIQIYVFSKEQRWAEYEAIIGDIFDHILAVLPEFNLRIFQAPSGADWRMAVGPNNG
ncbi:MAG: mechanosensitive ion channel family protein [Planctomycetes bacterium]|nr:mechanosensitive ion channel family protein [Planctomycetota bacterium]